ncbi:MAG: putative DNA-binding domain-containing protein [Rhizobiaceae bacterium]
MNVSTSSFAAALLDPAMLPPAGIRCAGDAPIDLRFAVYRNNVVISLTKALSQRFPVTKRLVGDEFFDGTARVFIRQSPPQCPILFAYGDDFPSFLSGFEPVANLPYLADVAQLEAQCTRAYHAADRRPLCAEDLIRIKPDQLAITRLTPHPAAALACSLFAIGSIWQAHQIEQVKVQSIEKPENVLVTRPAFEVQVHLVPQEDAVFLRAIFEGASLEDAAAAALDVKPDFDFGRALLGLTVLGAFEAGRTNAET